MLEAILAKSPSDRTYVEDVFNTYNYTGTGSNFVINNGINLNSTAAWSSYIFQAAGTDVAGRSKNAITVDSSGNIYIGAKIYESGFYRMAIVKYNSAGVVQWQIKNSEKTEAKGIGVDSSGNVFVASIGSFAGAYAGISKYNSSGVLQWQRKITRGDSGANALALDSSGNAYIAGYINFGGTPQDAILVAKYDTNGTIQWQRALWQGANSRANSIAVDSSGNAYVVGYSNNGTYDYFMIAKYDTNGTIQWQRSLSFSGTNAYGNAVALDSSGNVYVTGQSPNGTLTAKYNSSGTALWQREITGTVGAGAGGRAIAVDSSGNSYVSTGHGSGAGGGVFITKYDTSGTIQWQRFLTHPNTYQSSSYYNRADALFADSTNLYTCNLLSDGSSQIIATSILKQDGSTITGNAGLLMMPLLFSDSAGGAFTYTSSATDQATGATEAAAAGTDSAAGLTTSSGTQPGISSNGGMVWIKSRSATTDHALYDTVRGATFDIGTNLATGQTTQSTGLTGFGSFGFGINSLAKVNTVSATYVAWTFKRAPKFFDVVTYTGTGVARTISHNLGSVPGMIVVKPISESGNWVSYHRIIGNASAVDINAAAGSYASTAWNSTTPTSTNFSLGANTTVNKSGATYIAYIFAHNAGGFGALGADDIITCGSFVPGATAVNVTLGWEPQFVFYQNITAPGGSSSIMDNIRGMTALGGTTSARLIADSNGSEGTTSNYININETGFVIPTGLTSGATYMYVAIRRGPMKKPTDATKVFKPVNYAGTNNLRTLNAGFAPDAFFFADRSATYWGQNFGLFDKLRGKPYLVTSGSIAESDGAPFLTDYRPIGIDIANSSGMNNINNTTGYLDYFFSRAPGFFDIVCYIGTGASPLVVNHNLGVVPEIVIVKARSPNGTNWATYVSPNYGFFLNSNNSTNAVYNPVVSATGTTVSFTNNPNSGQNGTSYVAYLFASCPGVSKIGSYTGNGSALNIDCGFTNGARFVLIKRTDSTGDWYVWDTARGISVSNDPRLSLNSTAAEVTTDNSIDPLSSGFTVNQVTATNVNVNAATYIYLAIA